MGKNAPPPPNYTQAAQSDAQQAMLWNRPNWYDNSGAYQAWTQGPGGQQVLSTGFSGPLGGVVGALGQQAAGALGQSLNLGALPGLTSGTDAREQAINAAFGAATSRLDPMWQQREEGLRTQLLNRGLSEGSEAYRRAMGELGNQRTDAYQQALAGAIGQGTEAGQALFSQSLAARQAAMAEALRARQQPLAELGALQGLQQAPSFAQVQGPNTLAASNLQYQADMAQWLQQQQMLADLIGGGLQGAGTVASAGAQVLPLLLSDERLKIDLVRHAEEALPGVPLASWTYRPGFGLPEGRHVGVVAQDVQRVRPGLVAAGPGGWLYVAPALAPRRL